MILIDKKEIQSISVFKRRVNTWYKWLPEKKATWFKGGFDAGFYANGTYYMSGVYTYKEIEDMESLEIISRVVYDRPYVQLTFKNKTFVCEFFDSQKAMYDFINSDEVKSLGLLTIG